jgi:hypothetical protein
MSLIIRNITGQKFGRLTALKIIGKNKSNQKIWLFKCDCGNKLKCLGSRVISGNTSSCGCLRRELVIKGLRYKHGMRKTRFYNAWKGIKARCNNKNLPQYKDWGGRGIILCKEWLKFENFKDDMYKSYLYHVKKYGEKNTSIDRIDNNSNYCLENCRWSTKKEQARNTRHNHPIAYKKETLCLTAMAEKYNIPERVLSLRINRLKWPIEKALKLPVMGGS